VTIKWPDFSLMSKEDAIDWLRKQNDPKLERLIAWVAEASSAQRCYYEIRLSIAEAERRAVRKANGEEVPVELPADRA
jgi:hypothetical protein